MKKQTKIVPLKTKVAISAISVMSALATGSAIAQTYETAGATQNYTTYNSNPYGTPSASAVNNTPASNVNNPYNTTNSNTTATSGQNSYNTQQTNVNTTTTQTQSTATTVATANAKPITNSYGVPDENVIQQKGKVIKYQPGKNADPEQVIQQEQRSLQDKIVIATPQQIQKAKQSAYNTAVALDSHPNPGRCDKPRIINVSTSTESEMPKLRLNNNSPTNIVVSDAMGNTWAIDDAPFVSNDIDLIWNTELEDVSRITILPKRPSAQGSFTLELRGMPIPLVFEYMANQPVVDCLVHIQMDSLSPAGKAKLAKTDAFGIQANAADSADTELLSVALGKQPENSKELKTSNNSVRAWRMKDGSVIVRTRYDLVTPAPYSGTTAADGTKVYRVRYDNVYTYRNNDKYEMFTISRY